MLVQTLANSTAIRATDAPYWLQHLLSGQVSRRTPPFPSSTSPHSALPVGALDTTGLGLTVATLLRVAEGPGCDRVGECGKPLATTGLLEVGLALAAGGLLEVGLALAAGGLLPLEVGLVLALLTNFMQCKYRTLD